MMTVRFHFLSLLLCFLLLVSGGPVAGVGLPAGTQISLVANASFLNDEDQLVNAEPASVTLAVMRVAGVDIAQSGQVGQPTPGQDIYVPITITNTGNATDLFTLFASSLSSWSVDFIYDDNADGVHQEDEQWVITTAGPMVADGYTPCFARISIPEDASASDTVTLTAVSNYDAGISDQLQFTVDVTSPPSVAINSPTDGATYVSTEASVDLGGTASGGLDIVEVTWSTDHGTSGTCVGTSDWTAGDIGLVTGSNVITVTATDLAGRTSTATINVIYNDTTPPTVTIAEPVDSGIYATDDLHLRVAGAACDNVGVVAVSWSNNRGGAGNCTGTAAWTADSITLATGENVITVTALDAAGNVGTRTLTVTYAPDPVAPTVTITSPSSSATYTTDQPTVGLAGTASDSLGIQSVSWSSDRGCSGTCSGTTSWSASGITLSLGDNIITVTATNTSGLTSTDSIKITREGQQAPVVLITAPTSNASCTTGSTTIELGGTAAHDAGIASVSWSNLHVGSGACVGTDTWSAAGVPLKTGTNLITVTAVSALGDTAADTITVTCTAPSVTITSPTSASAYVTQRSSLDLAGTASGAVARVDWSSNRGTSGTCAGTTSWIAAGIPLVMGQNILTIAASDGDGNGDCCTLTVTREPDSTDPTIEINTPTDQGSVSRNCPWVTIGGAVSDNATITDVTYVNTTTGETGPCDINGTDWSATPIILVLGENQILVTATDGSGNTSSATLTVNYVDVVPGDAWSGVGMVSLPIIPDEADPKVVTGFSSNMWCTFLPAIGQYVIYPDQRVFFEPADETPGRGFWARFIAQPAVPYGTIPPQDQPVTIHLKAGWNQVGTPFLSEVVWDTTRLMVREPNGVAVPMCDAPDLTPGTAWGFRQYPDNPSTGEYYLIADTSVVPGAENTMQPWKAYWIRAFRDCDLIVPSPL